MEFKNKKEKREMAWMDINTHFRHHLVALGIAILLYIFVHAILRSYYQDNADESIRNAAKQYQVVYDLESGKYALALMGQPLTPELLESAGNLGIHRLSSVQGLIAEAQQFVAETNIRIARTIDDYSQRLHSQGRNTQTYRLAIDDITRNSQRNWFVEVYPPGNIGPGRFASGKEGLAQVSKIVDSAFCYSLVGESKTSTKEATPNLDCGLGNKGETVASRDAWVDCAAKQTVKQAWSAPRAHLRHRELQCEERLSDSLKVAMEQAYAPLTDYVEGSDSAKPEELKNKDSIREDNAARRKGSNSDVDLAAFTQKLQSTLADEATYNLGFFFLMGPYRWLEIAMITILGVLVEGATRLGVHITGRTEEPDEIWDPGETQRTLLKCLYAPIMSVFTVWTLIATDLVTVTVDGYEGMAAVISIAFIFGLFPNLPFAIMKRIAEAFFKSTSVSGKPKTGYYKEVTVDTDSSPKEQPPSFAQFKKKLMEHAAAPLKE